MEINIRGCGIKIQKVNTVLNGTEFCCNITCIPAV
ncbi:ST-I family heat-stable enterotoxin [uncultured Treponema sp.]